VRVERYNRALPRLFFVDNLRTALVVLVALHHIALVYGGAAPFYYSEPPGYDTSAFQVLLVFVLVNQAWFMGALFLLSGYFTPGSYDRKGPGRFLMDRLFRLGLPLLLFFFVINPLSSLGLYVMPAHQLGSAPPLTWAAYPDLVGLGPMWFVLMLIAFDLGYASWRWVAKKRLLAAPYRQPHPGGLFIAGLILTLASASFLFRMAVPIGKTMFGFPTLAYLPQYVLFFVIGIAASRVKGFQTLLVGKGMVGLIMAATAGIFLFPLAFSGQLFSLMPGPRLALALGNGNWQSAVYALWDSTFAVGICLGLIPMFRRFMNGSGPIGRFLSKQSFTVYVIHIPVIVFLAWTLRRVDLDPLSKFGLAVFVMVPACFVAASLIRRFAFKILFGRRATPG
jgi:hypothetical protein